MPRLTLSTTTSLERVTKRRSILFQLACLAVLTPSSIGFLLPSSSNHGKAATAEPTLPLHFSTARFSSALSASKSLTLSFTANNEFLTRRLSAEEETELLRQAVELRRLDLLEKELALKFKTTTPLLSVRAKAAGYGEDLEAYEVAKVDGQRARELLVTSNMGLVHYTVHQIIGKQRKQLNSLSRDDLVQEGAIGLARAVDKWNPAFGNKFSTYAVYWIRAAILRCIAERDDLLRVPSHVSAAVRKVNKAAQRLGLDTAYERDGYYWQQAKAAKQLAEEAGLSEHHFQQAMQVQSRRSSGGYVAFETWMQKKGHDYHSDVPTSTAMQSSSSTSSLETEQLRNTLSQFLRPKEMEALSWRYGLLNDENMEPTTPQERAKSYLAQAEAELFGSTTSLTTATATRKTQLVTKPQVMALEKQQQQASIPKAGRFGEAMSFNEVGKKMEVSAEYTRKLCHAALTKLRQAAEDGRLEPALLF